MKGETTMKPATKPATSSTTDLIRELGERWRDAELRGDVAALDALADDDLRLVGPLGFVLDKKQWLDRYRSGDFVTHELSWDEVEVRDYGDAAVAVGVHRQRAAYRGKPADGAFRATHVAVRRDGRWLLAGVHLSPIGQPLHR
jgi:ketosteroid isomerase-like protein